MLGAFKIVDQRSTSSSDTGLDGAVYQISDPVDDECECSDTGLAGGASLSNPIDSRSGSAGSGGGTSGGGTFAPSGPCTRARFGGGTCAPLARARVLGPVVAHPLADGFDFVAP